MKTEWVITDLKKNRMGDNGLEKNREKWETEASRRCCKLEYCKRIGILDKIQNSVKKKGEEEEMLLTNS